MDQKILNKLRRWRAEQARLEGVEPYRVLSNATLEALSAACPQTKEEFFAVKGFKEARWTKYGKTLLDIFTEGRRGEPKGSLFALAEESLEEAALEAPANQLLTVSEFLDGVNVELSGMAARIQGEVSSVDERERVVYFSLKDEKDESLLNCIIFRYQYDVSGVKLAVGDKVIAEGVPEIYKPYGKMSFKAGVLEVAGEGALKKAYDALRAKCEAAGLFALEKKRALPEFPERIALITSEQGAAIGDFTTNLGRLGLQIDFYPTSVEGKKAVFEILGALRFFNTHPERYDLLVMIRGGGSLESLQAFNNEAIVCAVAESKIPTLLGIGHEKDVPLATLAADLAVSTPTATARTLREPWERAREAVGHLERRLLATYEGMLMESRHRLEIFSHNFVGFLEHFSKRFQFLRERFLQEVSVLDLRIKYVREQTENVAEELLDHFSEMIKDAQECIERCEKVIERYDPRRALALGYSLIQKEGRLLRNAGEVKVGDRLEVRLAKGRLDSEVISVYNE